MRRKVNNEQRWRWLEKGIDMERKKVNYTSETHAAADQLLEQLRESELELDRLQMKLAEDLRAFQASQSKKIEWQKGKVDFLGESLKVLMKDHRVVFFPTSNRLGSYSVDLPHGALLYDKSDYVVKPRKVDVLANLERYGFEEAIRRTAAVDWDALDNKEEWPDEVLAIIGTRREIKETFAYEVVSSQLPVASKD